MPDIVKKQKNQSQPHLIDFPGTPYTQMEMVTINSATPHSRSYRDLGMGGGSHYVFLASLYWYYHTIFKYSKIEPGLSPPIEWKLTQIRSLEFTFYCAANYPVHIRIYSNYVSVRWHNVVHVMWPMSVDILDLFHHNSLIDRATLSLFSYFLCTRSLQCNHSKLPISVLPLPDHFFMQCICIAACTACKLWSAERCGVFTLDNPS